jgi:hypothetical protein
MKSTRKLFLLGLLVFGLTGCTESDCQHSFDSGVVIFNDSDCTRSVGPANKSPRPIQPGGSKKFTAAQLSAGLLITGSGCSGATSQTFQNIENGEVFRLHPNGSISRFP